MWTADEQRQEQTQAATEICRAFLEAAGITGIKTPFFTVKRVEAALALTPSGKTFPVWAIGLEIEEDSEQWCSYHYTMTQHIHAITGEFTDAGEVMSP